MAGKASDKDDERRLKQLFGLLNDATRLRIIGVVRARGEVHVTDLARELGMVQPAVSHHLALLRVSGLLESRREHKWNYYSLAPGCLEPLARFAAGK